MERGGESKGSHSQVRGRKREGISQRLRDWETGRLGLWETERVKGAEWSRKDAIVRGVMSCIQ